MKQNENNQGTGKKRLHGMVVRRAGDKTISVEVSRQVRHSVYNKSRTFTKRYLADDPKNVAHVGEMVTIEECRPLSRHKRWRLLAGSVSQKK